MQAAECCSHRWIDCYSIWEAAGWSGAKSNSSQPWQRPNVHLVRSRPVGSARSSDVRRSQKQDPKTLCDPEATNDHDHISMTLLIQRHVPVSSCTLGLGHDALGEIVPPKKLKPSRLTTHSQESSDATSFLPVNRWDNSFPPWKRPDLCEALLSCLTIHQSLRRRAASAEPKLSKHAGSAKSSRRFGSVARCGSALCNCFACRELGRWEQS